MNFFLTAIKKEPLGALAIIAALLPFIFDVSEEYIFNAVSIEVQCNTPSSSEFLHENGFLYYETRCLISNRSRDPISVASLVPVMTNRSYPYPIVGTSNFIPLINQSSADRLKERVEAMENSVPANLQGRQSFAFEAVFATSVGELRPYGPMSGCSDSLEFDRLSSAYSCISDGSGDHPAERRELSEIKTIKEQIYTGFSIFLADFDGFGLLLELGDGSRFIVQADMTDVSGYRCNDDIRELACLSFGSDSPKVIDIGAEPDYSSGINWRVVAFVFAISIVASILAQLVWTLIKFVFAWAKLRTARVSDSDTD